MSSLIFETSLGKYVLAFDGFLDKQTCCLRIFRFCNYLRRHSAVLPLFAGICFGGQHIAYEDHGLSTITSILAKILAWYFHNERTEIKTCCESEFIDKAYYYCVSCSIVGPFFMLHLGSSNSFLLSRVSRVLFLRVGVTLKINKIRDHHPS